MNKELQTVLASQELQNFFDSLLLQKELSKVKMLLTNESMLNQKRVSANALDIFIYTQNPPEQTIDQTVTTFREYCEDVFKKRPTDNLTFLKYFKDKLKNEILRGIFTRSNNSEVLQNYKIEPQDLAKFRDDILTIAGFLKPNEKLLKDKVLVLMAKDNLPYRKIRRNINIGFNKDHFDALKLFTNLIQCYELGFADEEIMFNGEYFFDHQTGIRLIDSNNPITPQNIQTVGRFNQAGFVLPEHLVYGFQNTPLSNDFSFTLSQENVTGGYQYKNAGYPLMYATKNGFFSQKKCEFAKTITTTNPQNQPMQCTYSYYTSLENDTSEKYVKVVEHNLETGQISIALYAYPLNHINAGIQVCRVDSNEPSFTIHNIGGKERIQTIFHMHKYNIIDQIRSEGEGEFDIMLKFDDNLTPAKALELFDDVCKTAGTPEQMYDENNNQIEVTPNPNASKPLTQKEITTLQHEALRLPFENILASYYDDHEIEEEFLPTNEGVENNDSNNLSTPSVEDKLTNLLIKALMPNNPSQIDGAQDK